MARSTKKVSREIPAVAPTRRDKAPSPIMAPSAVSAVLTDDQRRRMIAEAAYYRAERRGFIGGSPEQDWIEAEAEIDRVLQPIP